MGDGACLYYYCIEDYSNCIIAGIDERGALYISTCKYSLCHALAACKGRRCAADDLHMYRTTT